jgi:hypothetical protein
MSSLRAYTNGRVNPNIVEDYPAMLDEIDVDPTGKNERTTSTSQPLPMPSPFLESLGDDGGLAATDWSKSYHGLSSAAFPREAAEILQAPLDPNDIEMKPGRLALVHKGELQIKCLHNSFKMESCTYRKSSIGAFSTKLLVPVAGVWHREAKRMSAPRSSVVNMRLSVLGGEIPTPT